MADNEGELGSLAISEFYCFPFFASGYAHPVRQLHRGKFKLCSAPFTCNKPLHDLAVLPLCACAHDSCCYLQILWCAYVSLVFNAKLATVPDVPGHQAD